MASTVFLGIARVWGRSDTVAGVVVAILALLTVASFLPTVMSVSIPFGAVLGVGAFVHASNGLFSTVPVRRETDETATHGVSQGSQA